MVATQHSTITPDWIREATLDTESPQDALSALTRLQANPAARADLTRRVENAARHFRWDAIADRHAALYERLLQRKAAAGLNDCHTDVAPRSARPTGHGHPDGAARQQ